MEAIRRTWRYSIAIGLAKDQHSTLRLFHIIDLTTTYSSVPAHHVAEFREVLQMEGRGKRLAGRLDRTHGRRGIRRLFLGSVAEGLARITSKPLLLIRGV
jgi:hypothetical protein